MAAQLELIKMKTNTIGYIHPGISTILVIKEYEVAILLLTQHI
jgi:hypothetical protein